MITLNRSGQSSTAPIAKRLAKRFAKRIAMGLGLAMGLAMALAALLTPVLAQTQDRTAALNVTQLGPFEHHNVPGGIAIIPLGIKADAAMPIVTWNKKPIATLASADAWFAILGVPLSTEPGTHTINISTEPENFTLAFDVMDASYEEQRITLKSDRKVNPAPLDMERINREKVRLGKVKRTRTQTLNAFNFIWPVKGPISSTFGLRRFFNNQPRRPHGGIDIAMPTGTPIVAPADGTVIDTGEYFFNGNSVFIEHGLGVQTFYAHMDSISVEINDVVKQGDVIGTVGETGRVTGAHLHWSLGLNGTWVDPTLVLAND